MQVDLYDGCKTVVVVIVFCSIISMTSDQRRITAAVSLLLGLVAILLHCSKVCLCVSWFTQKLRCHLGFGPMAVQGTMYGGPDPPMGRALLGVLFSFMV